MQWQDVLLASAFIAILIAFLIKRIVRVKLTVNSLRKQFPNEFEHSTVTASVAYLSDTDLYRSNVIRKPISGVFLIGKKHFNYIGAISAGDTAKRLSWDLATLSVALLMGNQQSSGLPHLIRIGEKQLSGYFFVPGTLGAPDNTKTLALFESLQGIVEPNRRSVEKEPPGSNKILACFLASIVGLVALIAGISRHAVLIGPRLAATDIRGDVFIATATDIFKFDSTGELLMAVPLKEMGLSELAAIEPGESEGLLVADSTSGTIKQCDLANRTCSDLPGFGHKDTQFRNSSSFTRDPATGDIYISDTARHRIIQVSKDGMVQSKSGALSRNLCYPNGVVVSRNGEILVADTNNFRILRWELISEWGRSAASENVLVARLPDSYRCIQDETVEPSEDPFINRRRTYKSEGVAVAPQPLRQSSVWLSEFDELPDGRWWAIMNDFNMRRGEVVLYSSDWDPLLIAKLPDNADPWDLAVVDDRVLVADPVNSVVYDIDSQGNLLGEFAVTSLGKLKQDSIEMRKTNVILTWSGIFGIVLSLVVAVLLVNWRRKHRVNQILRISF